MDFAKQLVRKSDYLVRKSPWKESDPYQLSSRDPEAYLQRRKNIVHLKIKALRNLSIKMDKALPRKPLIDEKSVS